MPSPARALLVALVALAPALAGCLAAADETVRVTPYSALARAEPGRATEFALHVENRGSFRETLHVRVDGLPANWSFASERDGRLVLDGRSTGSLIVGVTPAEDAPFGVVPLRVLVGGGAAAVVVEVTDLGREPARPGVGAQVRTVGFWDNGTVFYTNMKEVRDNARLPWVKLSENATSDEAMTPIKAYVGGKRGQGVPEPYNSSGYVPLIEGFDERLRTGNGGMRAGESLAVRIPPEKAYTRPGNEEHRLYGDALNFLIEVVSVDVLDAATCVPGSGVCLPPPVG